MSTVVEFTTSFGQDNFLNIIAEVSPGDVEIIGGQFAQPGRLLPAAFCKSGLIFSKLP
jgi:hypothetical protein